jgi:UDP-N-acetyl-D-galactosamine dehydrogenase
MNFSNSTIAVIGLGYVGLPLAVEFGKHRYTLGFDINQTRVEELQSGQDYTLECSPEDLQSATHLRYSANMADLQKAQIFIVTVPTPVDKANRPDMTPLVKASETVGKALKATVMRWRFICATTALWVSIPSILAFASCRLGTC